jgi:hypothetical protein
VKLQGQSIWPQANKLLAEGLTMKNKSLILILLCWFALTPSYSSAQVTIQLGTGQENDWYQGHQGAWQRQGNDWRWRSTHGNNWFQGRQGESYRERSGWEFYANDGHVYRQGNNGWQWYDQYREYR